MVAIVVSRAWAQDGQTEFSVEPGSLPDVLRSFAAAHPDYRRRLLDEDGRPYGYLSIYLDEELVPRHRHGSADVAAGSTVTIIPPLVGG